MKQLWSPQELDDCWLLSDSDTEFCKNVYSASQLAVALQLKFLEHEGRFPSQKGEIAALVIRFVAKQLGVPRESLDAYDWGGRTTRRHRAEIRSRLGFRKPTVNDAERLKRHLVDTVAPLETSRTAITEAAFSWHLEQRIEPPTAARLDRTVASALRGHESTFFDRISRSLSDECKAALDRLLVVSEEKPAPLTILKADPARPSLEVVRGEIAKLAIIDDLGLPQLPIDVRRKILDHYRQRAATELPSKLKERMDASRYALLAMYCWVRRREIIDDLVELLIRIVHGIASRAERKVVKELVRDIRKVRGKTTLLFRLAEAALEHPDDTVRDVLYPVVDERTLSDIVAEYRSAGPGYLRKVHSVVRASYGGHYRRILPLILNTLRFRSNNARHQPVIDAIDVIRRYRDSRQVYLPLDETPIDGVLRKNMHDILVVPDSQGVERVNRINYEIAVFEALRAKLRCKEIWVEGADKFRNPDEDLPADYADNRSEYYRRLDLPLQYDDFAGSLKASMTTALAELNQSLPKDTTVRISASARHAISVSPLETQKEPQNVVQLKTEIQDRWPNTGLIDILKEADLRLGFTQCFKTAADRQAIPQSEAQRRLLLCLYGLGTNAGLKRVSAGRLEVSYRELLYTRRRFLQRNTLRDAIAMVANGIFSARLPEIWGEGTTSCASDSKKFGAWDQNLMTEWHIRYGGRGIMIYWHVEKKSTCIYSQLKRCSSSEVAAMIQGVLRHCTDMSIERQYVDSHGQSEVAFAFTHLLGFDLLPRLKAINRQKLYTPDGHARGCYAHLEPALTRPINWALIEQQYDEMVKYATALKEGTADAESILRRFTRNNVQHPTYRALNELGKAVKTIFLCRYLSSESLRREIHEGLNVVENWNSANSFIFYGKGGEVASNRFEEQELSVLSLHLLQICLVYVNTLMIQNVLGKERWEGRLGDADRRALTPLIYSHINPYGVIELDMDRRIPLAA